MRKQHPISITIPNPCEQQWGSMRQVAGGRFCDHCSEKVIDFTTWSDTELHSYFIKRNEHVCGRFLDTQLDRTIRISYQPHSKLYRIAVALGAALLFTQVPDAKAHTRPPMVWSPTIINGSDSMTATDTTTGSLTGQVLDDKKEPVVNASVVMKKDGWVKATVVTDFDGNYSIKGLEPGTYDLTISYIGFETKTITGMPIEANKQITFNITLQSKTHLQILGGPVIRYRKPLTDPYETKTIMTGDEIKHKPGW